MKRIVLALLAVTLLGIAVPVVATPTTQVMDAAMQSQFRQKFGALPGGRDFAAVIADIEDYMCSIEAQAIEFADSGSKTTADTVDEALDEIYVQLTTTEYFLPVSINALRLVDDIATPTVGDTTANGGVLSSNTHPIAAVVGTGSAGLTWSTTNVCQAVMFQLPLPPNLDDDATNPLTLHFVLSKTGTQDTMNFGGNCFFNGGTAIAVAAGTVAEAKAEYSINIVDASVPVGATDVTCAFGPYETTPYTCTAIDDNIILYAVWLEADVNLH